MTTELGKEVCSKMEWHTGLRGSTNPLFENV